MNSDIKRAPYWLNASLLTAKESEWNIDGSNCIRFIALLYELINFNSDACIKTNSHEKRKENARLECPHLRYNICTSLDSSLGLWHKSTGRRVRYY